MTAEKRDCPDWRDAEAYPSNQGELKDWEWRWQFMRRSRDYRRFYFSLPRNAALDPNLEFEPDDSSRGIGLAGYSPVDEERIWNALNTRVVWNPTIEKHERNPFILEKGGGLFWLPERAYWEEIESGRQFTALLGGIEQMGLLKGDESPYVYVRFDVTAPLIAQLKRARDELEEYCGKERSPRLTNKARNLWPLYLRLIDADDAGAKPMQIFRQLEKDGVEEIQEAANEASKIKGMIEAARKVQEKVIFNL
jgi:hypothetical protein